MTVRGAAVGGEIEGEYEGSFHEMVGRNLDACVSVVYPKTTEERLIGKRTGYFTGRVQGEAFGG